MFNISHLLISRHCLDPQQRLLMVFASLSELSLETRLIFFFMAKVIYCLSSRNTYCFYFWRVCSAWYAQVIGTDDRFTTV